MKRVQLNETQVQLMSDPVLGSVLDVSENYQGLGRAFAFVEWDNGFQAWIEMSDLTEVES
ncbi:MAG: hypothetical protein HC882_10065 [Acidobacteria bacterium]|nr:hypothetical protein [Acidobacteriota bacterium]